MRSTPLPPIWREGPLRDQDEKARRTCQTERSVSGGSLSSFVCIGIALVFFSGLSWLAIAAAVFPYSFPASFHIQFNDFRDRLFDSPPPPYSSTAGDVAALLTLSTRPPPSMGCSGWSMLLLLSA